MPASSLGPYWNLSAPSGVHAGGQVAAAPRPNIGGVAHCPLTGRATWASCVAAAPEAAPEGGHGVGRLATHASIGRQAKTTSKPATLYPR